MKAVIIRLGDNYIKLFPNYYHQEYVLSLDNKANLVCELIIDKTDQKDSIQTDQSKETYTLKIGLLTINVSNKLYSSLSIVNDEIYIHLNKVL